MQREGGPTVAGPKFEHRPVVHPVVDPELRGRVREVGLAKDKVSIGPGVYLRGLTERTGDRGGRSPDRGTEQCSPAAQLGAGDRHGDDLPRAPRMTDGMPRAAAAVAGEYARRL